MGETAGKAAADVPGAPSGKVEATAPADGATAPASASGTAPTAAAPTAQAVASPAAQPSAPAAEAPATSAPAADTTAAPQNGASAPTAAAGPPATASNGSATPSAASQPAAAERAIPALPDNADELLKEFYAEVKSVDRDNEVIRILSAFKLNPFEQLGVYFDATPEEIRRAYRKLSLLVHPDKCTHEHAKSAFEVVNNANKQLADENIKRELIHVLNLSRDEVRKDRAKAIKNDATHRLAILLDPEGEVGVAKKWEGEPEFHAAWKAKSRDLLAKAAFRRQKLTLRLKEEEARLEEDENETRKKLKANREHHKAWEGNREKRIGSWREFEKKKPKKAKTGIKPPKLKEEDEERTFVQRAVGNTGFQPVGKYEVSRPQRE
mmetsp:Transcript_14765/g.44609  ORF Transcript_14765/g.44609 Transcript_14765/m.44609 type:complete len:380 (-) Transcript_14765:1142-2281(-)|eukprot:CAMPEP_0206147242 /NCGR_PEP_ID=MMETSP1473-20131121/32879_1 /ASSEMBLY_ACC=CAM_ASM_001109 /TAXON_ID=1461547 /ORGANISM="Stichococcus sp, Strain RCC1054" /LENGTH=379 /DNA_ID=CAMNT_0053544109 /DNA_START=62 /DNA_END=1201 /DNA_ORIENTATION=-